MAASSGRWSSLLHRRSAGALPRFLLHTTVLSAYLLAACPAFSQVLPGAWLFGSSTQADGRKYLASLRASTLLQSGGEEGNYAPQLVVSCTVGDPQHWQQQLILEEPLTSRGIINMHVALDNGTSFDAPWVVSGDKRTATKVGSDDLVKLSGARKLTLQWNWGWSWLWLSDEARFEIGDLRTVLFVLAKSCSVPPPA